MGLHLDVYRQAGAEPCGGISDTVDRITVVNVPGPDTPSDDAPAFVLVAHRMYRNSPSLHPADLEAFKGQRGPSMGGNYAGGSWNRNWRCAVQGITGYEWSDLVPIHDRFEEGE